MKILALDLGKFNTMCSFFDTETQKHEFLNSATDRHFLTSVFKSHPIDLVVMEACRAGTTGSAVCALGR
jgi:transposase